MSAVIYPGGLYTTSSLEVSRESGREKGGGESSKTLWSIKYVSPFHLPPTILVKYGRQRLSPHINSTAARQQIIKESINVTLQWDMKSVFFLHSSLHSFLLNIPSGSIVSCFYFPKAGSNLIFHTHTNSSSLSILILFSHSFRLALACSVSCLSFDFWGKTFAYSPPRMLLRRDKNRKLMIDMSTSRIMQGGRQGGREKWRD